MNVVLRGSLGAVASLPSDGHSRGAWLPNDLPPNLPVELGARQAGGGARPAFLQEQVSHVVFTPYMVVWIALMGVSGISPAILWCRRAYKAAASLVGEVAANRLPGSSEGVSA